MKAAICGLQHGHAVGLAKHLRAHPDLQIVAVAEAQPETCADTIEKAQLEVTHASLDELLLDTNVDLVAVCDIYTRRGAQIIRALEAGKHVITDKPMCTSLEELDRISALVNERGLSCFTQLTLRYHPVWHAARRALLDGEIGALATVQVEGRHPLNYRQGRPDWYFEEGRHGGTINDLFVHGLDGVEWLTGISVDRVVAARSWNQQLKSAPCFQDCAQAMFQMHGGAGVLMDASYTTPSGHKDKWTLHFNGTEGDLHVRLGEPVTLRRHHEPLRTIEPDTSVETGYVDELVNEINGKAKDPILTTDESLRAARLALTAQQAADTAQTQVPIADPVAR